MNTNNVVSAPGAANLAGKEHFCVKMTSTGVNLATSSDGALLLGTLQRAAIHQEDGVYAGKAVSVFRRYAGIHYAVIGFSSASVAQGATLALDAANSGKLVPSASNVVAIAWDAFTAVDGAIVRVAFV